MNLPRILVVDDQYTLDNAERQTFIDHTSVIDIEHGAAIHDLALAEAVFCSGQRYDANVITNDYTVIRQAIADGAVNSSEWALVLLDVRFDSGRIGEIRLPDGHAGDDHFGEDVRKRLARDFPDLPVVMLSSKKQHELTDRKTFYLSKTGIKPQDIAITLLRHGRLSRDQQRNLLALPNNVVAEDPSSFSVFGEAFAIAGTDISVLILGETGTGKEVLARYIHDRSSRADRPFVPVNVAAIPAELVESELFGHEKGSFTGADRKRTGRFAQAHGGTLFLDEIGDMPASLQAKVLRVLQDGEVMPVGGTEPVTVDVRIIAATSRNLAAMQQAGAFREDLTRRISGVTLTIPPLRKRREDIAPLVKIFLDRYSLANAKEGISIDEEALAVLETHPFQGNVGELQNIVQGLVSHKGNHSVISVTDVQEAMAGSFVSAAAVPPATPKVVPSQSAVGGLAELAKLIESWPIPLDDPSLNGGKTRVERAVRALKQRMAGAALERVRDPRDGSLNRQAAMQLLTGEENLKGKGPGREINEILGRKADHPVSPEDLEFIVSIWKKSTNKP